jgi:hypothetical protein
VLGWDIILDPGESLDVLRGVNCGLVLVFRDIFVGISESGEVLVVDELSQSRVPLEVELDEDLDLFLAESMGLSVDTFQRLLIYTIPRLDELLFAQQLITLDRGFGARLCNQLPNTHQRTRLSWTRKYRVGVELGGVKLAEYRHEKLCLVLTEVRVALELVQT